MGRPSKFNRDDAVELVMNEIWQNGFEACSVKAISEKLGITRSSFYNAFKSREALFMEALQLYARRTPNRVLKNIDKNTKITAAITKLFRDLCHFQITVSKGRGCMAVNCITELSAVNHELAPILKDLLLTHIENFKTLLETAVSRGELDSTLDTSATATSLQTTLLGISTLAKVVKNEDELWSSTKQILMGLGVYNDELLKDGDKL